MPGSTEACTSVPRCACWLCHAQTQIGEAAGQNATFYRDHRCRLIRLQYPPFELDAKKEHSPKREAAYMTPPQPPLATSSGHEAETAAE